MSRADIHLTDEFQQCIQAVDEGRNVFITGKAGTGKSTLLRLICETQRAKRYAVVAPTGVAALNVDGETIHKCFAFRPELTIELRKYRPPNHLKNLELLVIDEVSMAKADLMDMVETSLQRAKKNRQPFGGVQLVLVGDLFQLPPVQSRDDDAGNYYATPFFFSSRAIARTRLETIELTSVFRQKDEEFISILNAIRDGSISESALDQLNCRVETDFDTSTTRNCITLAARNARVNEINQHQLSILPGEEQVYIAEQQGEADPEKHKELKELRLKTGAQVMMLVNQHGYVNGSLGQVLSLSNDVISVQIDGLEDVIEVSRNTWRIFDPTRRDEDGNKIEIGSYSQFPMKLAWAVTVHKSQGKTFNHVVFDSSYSSQPGQTYVALSRCTSLNGLVLSQPIKPLHVKVSPHVLRFHRKIRCTTAPISSFTKAFVGIVTTGSDQYRKLAEIAIIRHEIGKRPVAFSTLINPHRDLCDATKTGLAASEMTLCPDIVEARQIIALVLSHTVPVGFRVDDLFELSGWTKGVVTEGVPLCLPLSDNVQSGAAPSIDESSLDAMALAEAARDHFLSLPSGATAAIQASPFLMKNTQIDDCSYSFPRPHPTATNLVDLIDLARNFPPASRANLIVGLSIGGTAEGRSAKAAMAREASGITPVECEALVLKLYDVLLKKAEYDGEVTETEAAALRDFVATWNLPRESPEAVNNRECVEIKPGMQVCLTGKTTSSSHPCHGWTKARIKERAEPHGLSFTDKVTKRDAPDIVALLDISQESRKAEKARKWGIPIVTWKDIADWADEQNGEPNGG